MGVSIGVIHQTPLPCGAMGFLSMTRRMLSLVVLTFLLLLLLASTLHISSPVIPVDGWKNGAGVPPSHAPVYFLVNAGPSSSAEESSNLARRRKAAAAPAATVARPLRNRISGDSPIADEYSPDYARKVREASGESDVSVSPLGYRMGETLPVTVYVRTERRTSHFLSFTAEYDGEVLEMETKKPKWEDRSEADDVEKDDDEEEDDEDEEGREEEDAVVGAETDLEEEETLEKNQNEDREASWSGKKKAKTPTAAADSSEDHSENPSSVDGKDEGIREAAVSDADNDNGVEASSSSAASFSSSFSSKKKRRKVPAEMMSTTAASSSSSSSETETVAAVTPLPIKKKRRRGKKSRRPISSPRPHTTTTTLIPLSQDSNVEMELRLASSMRQSKNQLVRNIPTALSPRMGVNHEVRIPVLTWMTQAAASMQNYRKTGSDNDNQEMESTLAFRFSVSGHGRKKETTWFPLVSRVRQDGFHVEHEARLDYAEHKGRSTRAEADSGAAAETGKQRREDGGHHSDSSESEAEEYPMRYLSGLTFYFGFRSGVFNTITSLSMRAYYSETLTRELVVQYQWDEHRPYNSHYGITLVSVCSVICSAVMLYVILGGPPVEDIVRCFFCGFFFKHRRLRRSGASRKANRVSAKFYDIVEAVHHHED